MRIWFIDTELSGMRAFDEIIDFAILEFREDHCQPDVIFNSLLRGAEEVTLSHQELTGISTSDIQSDKLPTIKSVLKKISSCPSDVVLCSYGLQFDLDWIYHSAALSGISAEINLPGLCLMEAIEKKVGRRVSLDSVLNISRPKHRAMQDAWLHYEIFKMVNNKERLIRRFEAKSPQCLL